ACFFSGKYNHLVIGAICTQFAQIFDCADGMLARTKNMCSDYGSFLDLTVDRVVDFLFLGGISIGIYHSTSDMRLLLIGFFTTGLYFLQISLAYVFIRFFGKGQPGETEEARALFILLISIFAVLNRLDIFIYLILIETIINLLLRLGNLVRLRYKNQS
ncbi:MAG: CDP-alcohol phosphatidyltransferase family protein, partial [Candidatus Aminicenantes bacterium]|nr:CDP-alcohol phosphatidyltransferase family protein [Candidatus Aminicenantes bacterium]